MNIVVSNGISTTNVWSETTVIQSFQSLKQSKYTFGSFDVRTFLSQLLSRRKIVPRVSYNGDKNSLEKEWHQCLHCPYKTRFFGNLNSHMKVMHSHDRRRRGKFEKHNTYQCGLCRYETPRKQALKNHMIARHCEATDSECPKCHIILKNKLCVRAHLQYCGKAPVFKCNNCDFKTRYRTHLTRHLSNVHTNDAGIECPNQCGSVLKNKESLRGHLNFCGTELFSVQCRYCPFRPKRKNLLKLHMTRVHWDKNNLTNECPKCTKKFKKIAYLKKHIPNCNSRKVLQCSSCSLTFFKKCLLEQHLKKHLYPTSEDEDMLEPYSDCPRCGTGFKYQEELAEHLVRCGHETSFQCYHCPYKAKIKDHLKNHILCAHIESNEFYQINMRNYLQYQPLFNHPVN